MRNTQPGFMAAHASACPASASQMRHDAYARGAEAEVARVQGSDVDWSAALRAVPVHIVTPDTKFEKVLEALSVHKLHRVYVLDKAEKATGIITLTDILRQVLPKVEEIPSEGPASGLPHSSEVPGADQGDDEMQTEETGAGQNGAV